MLFIESITHLRNLFHAKLDLMVYRDMLLKKAERFIKNAGQEGGADALIKISFANKHNRKIRVDIEILKGKAFISLTIFVLFIIIYFL